MYKRINTVSLDLSGALCVICTIRNENIASIIFPVSIKGLFLPNLESVLSTTYPIKGSVTPSQILIFITIVDAATTPTPTNPTK